MKEKLVITPATKIRELIDVYPELEEKLVEMAPAFRKLKNPVLRNTIARVTTLSQAALIGDVDVNVMVNRLRQASGQALLNGNKAEKSNITNEKPDWLKEETNVATIDARPMLEAGQHPMAEVFSNLSEMQAGGTLKLITGFIPAPLIDKAKEKGFLTYPELKAQNEVHTYFYKP
jgi:uncharacterized protein (DUF2249 family)